MEKSFSSVAPFVDVLVGVRSMSDEGLLVDDDAGKGVCEESDGDWTG